MQEKTRGGNTVTGLFLIIFFDYVKFKIIKLYTLYKTVSIKAGLGRSFEIGDVGLKPDGLFKVKLKACFFQSRHNLVSPGVAGIVLNGGVFNHVIVVKKLYPGSQLVSPQIFFLNHSIENE